MKKVITIMVCIFVLSTISAQEQTKFSISGRISSAERGDTLRFNTVSPDWSQMTPTFDIVIGRSGKVKYKGTHPHSQNYAYYYHSKDTTYKVYSCHRAGKMFITEGEIKMEVDRDYIYLPILKGGVYDEELQLICEKDYGVDKERDDLYKRYKSVDIDKDAELSKEYQEEFNSFYSQKQIMERRDEVEKLKKYYFNNYSNEYVALEILSYAGLMPLDSLEGYYNRQTQSVKESYYGVELNNKINQLKALEPQMPAPDFTLTTITGEVVTKESLRGKYLLIYHYGLCPGSLALDKRLSNWYKNHKDRVEVVGYTSSRESIADLAKKTKPGSKTMGIDLYEALQSMTNHPWRYEVDADFDDVNGELNKIYDIGGLPFFIFISPEGIILDRGFKTFYNGALKVVDASAEEGN